MLRQSSPGVPSGVMVACASWRALGGWTEGVRALAFLPSQVLLPCRHCARCVGERARGKIEWLCIQERWNPEVVIILGTAACYRRATVGSSHDDVHPDNPTLHTGAVRPHPGFVESLLFISSRNGACAQVFEMLSAFSCISWACIFAGDGAAIFFSGLIGLPFGVIKRGRHVSVLTQWAGSSGISWCIRSLVKKTLHCRRAGFEPQRTSSFRKRVRAHQVLGEAVRARTTIPHFVLTL